MKQKVSLYKNLSLRNHNLYFTFLNYFYLYLMLLTNFAITACNKSEISKNNIEVNNSQEIHRGRFISLSDIKIDLIEMNKEYFSDIKHFQSKNYPVYFMSFEMIINNNIPYENDDMISVYGESDDIYSFKFCKNKILIQENNMKPYTIERKIYGSYLGKDSFLDKIADTLLTSETDTLEIISKEWYVGRDLIHNSLLYQTMYYIRLRESSQNNTSKDSLLCFDGDIINTFGRIWE